MIWNLWEHQGMWGHNIHWTDWQSRRLGGHLPNRYEMKEGQELRARMESGKIARFEIVDIEFCSDPRDMLFFTVKDIGYLE